MKPALKSNPHTTPKTDNMSTTTSPSKLADTRSHGLGCLLIIDALLSFAPVAILGSAIGWPASLGKPAAEQMAAIHAAPGAVALGYGLYLLYSVLIAPVMIALAARSLGGLHKPWAATVAVFGALSALARAIGIMRWLTVMPTLAAAHAVASPETRTQLEQIFSAISAYGGGIGEVLGVSLFMALSLGGLCLGAARQGGMPRLLAVFCGVVALLLAALAMPAFGLVAVVPVALAASLLSAWMLALGVWHLWR